MKDFKLEGIYVITDPIYTPYEGGEILNKVEKALKGGIRIFQFREKEKRDEEIFSLVKELKVLIESWGGILIVNDRVSLAQRLGASGVHIGKEDMDLKKARQILGEGPVIGVSCYNSLELAILAEKEGANYVAFGSVFPSKTKKEAKRASLELIREAKKTLKIPVCAIGGINLKNVKEVILAGADLIAMISGFWEEGDPYETAKKFTEFFYTLKSAL